MSAWQMNAATGERWLHTSTAAEKVVAARGEVIRHAIGSPATDDYGELTRMGPEKAMAFTQSLIAIMHARVAVQSAWWRQAEAASRLLSAGRVPTVMECASLWSGAAEMTFANAQFGAHAGRDARVPVARQVSVNISHFAPR